ncbi:MAG: PepSY domain-containing protein [Eubacterium sp.]|nr:PepSY domain-containing protein [Eubacterium sp.]
MKNENKEIDDMNNNKKSSSIIIFTIILAVVIIAVAVISHNRIIFNNKPKPTDSQNNSAISQSVTDTSISTQNSEENNSDEILQTTDNNKAQTDNVSGKITIEAAIDIALKNSDVAQERLIYISAHEECNKSTAYYEVTFSDSSYDYEYEIDLSADIISYEKKTFEPKNNSKRVLTADTEYIGVGRAQNIAITDSSISSQDIGYSKVTLEKDNGIYIYEIEFKTSTTKYEYEINAASGEIIDQSLKAVKK